MDRTQSTGVWRGTKSTNEAAPLEQYLRRYPSGKFSELALYWANAGYAVGTVLAVQFAQLLPQRRMMVLMNQSENLRQIEYEMERFWMVDQPSHLTPERVHGGVGQ